MVVFKFLVVNDRYLSSDKSAIHTMKKLDEIAWRVVDGSVVTNHDILSQLTVDVSGPSNFQGSIDTTFATSHSVKEFLRCQAPQIKIVPNSAKGVLDNTNDGFGG